MLLVMFHLQANQLREIYVLEVLRNEAERGGLSDRPMSICFKGDRLKGIGLSGD